jgi:hypothetical protein
VLDECYLMWFFVGHHQKPKPLFYNFIWIERIAGQRSGSSRVQGSMKNMGKFPCNITTSATVTRHWNRCCFIKFTIF